MRTGRVVVVTGAGGGMGRPIVERFLANGDAVIATDIRRDALDALSAHPRLETIAADVTSEADCAEVASLAEGVGCRVDVLVNAAGWYPVRPFEDLSVAAFREVVDVNLVGTFAMVRATWPLMKGRGWGRIVNVGSASIFEGVPDQLHYVAAKAGLLGLSRSLARAVGSQGVTVNVVMPGLTPTPPVRATLPAAMLDAQVAARSIPREQRPEDVAGPILFLASPEADFITGQTIVVDGGKHML